jgi:hypothetical protein
MTMRTFLLWGALFLAAGATANCSGSSGAADDEGCRRGTERCQCTAQDECDPGLACRSGLCVDDGGGTGGGGGEPGCGTGQASCDGVCVLLSSDDGHCGDCDTACPGGSSCSDGACACSTGLSLCDSACVNLQADGMNCGDCGTECTGGAVCTNGLCVCPEGRSACGGVCVDVSSNATNCGACDLVCDAEQVCSDGACTDSCRDGLTQCGQSCVDVDASVDHCGDCDNPCGPELVCDAGACACAGSSTACNGECVDTETDATHCGSCTLACAAGQSCEGGNCVCPGGRTLCGGSCVDTDESPQNCGACGFVCLMGADCVDGVCEGGGTGGSAGTGGGGNGGGSGKGGASGSGGNGGTSGSGGAGGMSGGGTGGNGGSGGMGTGGVPVVMILIDGSSSMFEPRTSYWDPAYEALMDPTDGALAAYADRIRFGLAVFQGSKTPSTEPDPACATMSVSSIAADNRAAIDVVYKGVGDAYVLGQKWETPTGHAVNRVTTTLNAYTPDPPGPKYIVLVTDGNPNTCRTVDPQCGQDLAIKAVQDARVAGIRTLVLGMGDILTVNSGCTPTYMHCGLDHLKDMANAGLGLGVSLPPDQYQYQTCVSYEGGLKAAYSSSPGDADIYSGTTMAELRSEMLDIFERIASGGVP